MLIDVSAGGYRFLPGGAAFSSGVVAQPGFALVHAVFRAPVPYVRGFVLAKQHLEAIGRPFAAICAVELRVPAPLTFAEFAEFNVGYVQLLHSEGLLVHGSGPMARTNVAPVPIAPDEPSMYAFAYTVPQQITHPNFVLAGIGDLRNGTGREAIVRVGETSEGALREKASFVMASANQQMSSLGVAWNKATEVAMYTVEPAHAVLAEIVLPVVGEAAQHGIHWYYSRPPIQEVVFELDVRGFSRRVILN